jgi:hypothetical protein
MKKQNWKRCKEEMQLLKTERNIMLTCLMIVAILNFFMLLNSSYSYKKSFDNNVNVTFINMSEEEIITAKDIIDSLKPEYLGIQKSITFTNTELYSGNDSVWGVNRNKGELFIRWTGDKAFDIDTISHELCHTFVYVKDDDLKEFICRDLARLGVGFA